MSNLTARINSARISAKSKYTPAYTKPGTGETVPQKCVLPVMVNNPPFLSDAGALIQGGKVLMFITAWGKMADTCAKYLDIGKEFSCDVNINSYESRVMDNITHTTALNSAGQAIVVIKHGFTMIPSTFRFGQDSQEQIAKEDRPIGWDGKLPVDMIEAHMTAGTLGDILAQAKQGPAMWQTKRDLLKKLVYVPGMAEFGKALVTPAPGVAQAAYAPPLSQAVAAATVEKTVNGFTLAQLRSVGWRDDQLIAAGYGDLLPKAVPMPPSTIAPPAPPAIDPEVLGVDEEVGMTVEAGSGSTV